MLVEGDYEQGYAWIRNLLPREVIQAFLAHFKEEMESRNVALSSFEQQLSITGKPLIEIYGFRHPPLIALLWGLTPAISSIVKRDLLPTYCVLRFYREGDVCKVHSDRDACEHSLSLTLDYSDGVPWELDVGHRPVAAPEPLQDDFADEPFTSVPMEAGDAVVYQGIKRRHGRIRPNPNQWSAHMFLHWVSRDGPYRDCAFDGRYSNPKPVNFSI
jgi:hypothetical protein